MAGLCLFGYNGCFSLFGLLAYCLVPENFLHYGLQHFATLHGNSVCQYKDSCQY